MTWFAVDDSFHGHPKITALESGPCFAEAIALWTLAGSWCAQHLTDGFVPEAQIRKLVPFRSDKVRRTIQELIRNGLWEAAEGGFNFRDWEHYQPTKSEVEKKRVNGAARTRKSRAIAKLASLVENETDMSCNAVTASVTNAERNAIGNASVMLSRPVPSPLISPDGEISVATPSVRSKIRDLESRYSEPLIRQTRNACALSRQGGKMSDSVWLQTLERMQPHPIYAVESAMRLFCDKHADGSKNEKYLLGIIRGELKRPSKQSAKPFFDNYDWDSDPDRLT